MKKRTLKFNENGKFRILVLTDLHEYKSENKETQNKTEDALLFIETTVKALSPDLVVYNGDNAFGKTEKGLKETIDAITKTVRELDIPFTMVLGNHEHDARELPPEMPVKIFSSYENSLVREDKKGISGYANHYISIKGKGNKNKYLLFFIDSGKSRSDFPELSGYDWVKDDQIEWFENVCDQFKEKNNGEYVPAIVFQHMPVTEIYNLLDEVSGLEVSGAIKGQEMFSNRYFVLKEGVKGDLLEGPCPPDYNNGQFDSWKCHGVKGAFFGHDHKNDFEGTLDGILLAQVKGTGFNGYSDGIKTGVKLITIDENNLPQFETKDYYFTDFGLVSKSAVLPHQVMTEEQKKNVKNTAKKIGLGVAAVTVAAAVGTVAKKIFKKK